MMTKCMRIGVASLLLAAHAAHAQIALAPPPNSFAGIAEDETVPSIANPADPEMAVGVQFILQAVNSHIRAWNRADLPAHRSTMDLEGFLGLFDSNGTDPRIIFDPDEGRFLVSVYGFVAGKPGRQIVVGVSETEAFIIANGGPDPDPLDPAFWTIIPLQGRFNKTVEPIHPLCAFGDNIADGALFVDQPRLGFAQNVWLVSGFLASSAETRDSVFYLVDKQTLAHSDPLFVAVLFCDLDPLLCCAQSNTGLPIPMPSKGGTGTTTAFFVGVDEIAQTPQCGLQLLVDSLVVYAVTDPMGDEGYHHAKVTVGCFDASPQFVPTLGDPPDGGWPGEAERPLDPTDGRVTSVQHRVESGEEFLYVTLSANEPPSTAGSPDRAVVKWYKIDLKGWPSGPRTPVVVESGQIAATPQVGQPIVHYFFPSGVVNADGTFGIVAARAGAGETAEIAFWARLANGTVVGPDIAKPSAFGDTPDIPLMGDSARWGDYFDIELDPLDNSFWLTGMYMKSGGQFGELWGTWVRNAEAE
jgi:hypothetical protein